MNFLENERLYSRTVECLAFLRNIPDAAGRDETPRHRCHMYWRGPFTRKQTFALKSFLATHSVARWDLWLWRDAEAGGSDPALARALGDLLPHVSIKRFDPIAEAAGTPLEGRHDLETPEAPVRRSNFVRSLVLYNHGGVYVDLDTMFLRDLAAIFDDGRFSEEFCYSWSSQRYGNSAVLALRKGSDTAARLLSRCAARNSCRPSHVLQFDEAQDLDLLVLPSAFFDPLWLHHDRKDKYADAPFNRFQDFFRRFDWRFRRPRELSFLKFFPGAFAYHWHNGWEAVEHDESYFGVFEAEFDRVLRERQQALVPTS